MLPLTLFRSRTFAGTNLLTFLLYAALGGTLFFLPLNLIQVQHYSPTAAGAVLLPFILIMSFLSGWSGGLVARYGPKLPLVVGPVITAVGYLLFLLPGIGGNYWTDFFPPAVVLGLGMAITVAPLTTTVMNSIAQNRAGIASGVNNAVARTASLVAIAVLGVVMLHVFKTSLDHRLISANLPASVAQSMQTQSIRLAAIDIPQNLESRSTTGNPSRNQRIFRVRISLGDGDWCRARRGKRSHCAVLDWSNATCADRREKLMPGVKEIPPE